MEEHPRTPGTRAIGRRRLLGGAAAAGLAALVAARAGGSASVATPRLSPATEPDSQVSGVRSSPSPVAEPTSVPTAAMPLDEETKLRHLLRRAGFGAGPADLDQYRPLGVPGAVDRLVDYEQVDNSALEEHLARHNVDPVKRVDLQRWWLLRMIYTARPLEEKMVLFWHGLLTSAFSKVGRPELMLEQNRFFRDNALGRFPDILKGISRDPAMMVWLDLSANRKGRPNENYARELLELFSLGIGNYTEQDVREGARAFTGWSLQQQRFVFNRNQHDDGVKSFLGRTGRFDGDDVVDAIVQLPASARFIARRLFGFFAYPDPSEEVLTPLMEVYTSSDYSIRALVRAILTSEAFYSPRAYRALVKSPVELVVGTARVLGLETDGKGLPLLAARMGQEPFNPPNVAGWPGGRSWLTSGSWLDRLNFANRIASAAGSPPARGPGAGGSGVLDLEALAGGATAAAEIADRLANLLLDGQIDPAQRQVLIDYLTPANGSPVGSGNRWRDERRRGALYLTLAMPEYQLG